MTPVHLHLLINHAPVFGTAIACLILVYALLRNKDEVRHAALGLLVLVALITPIVFFSGDNSVETVKKITSVTEAAIDAHDEAAEGAFATIVAVGVLALIQLILIKFPTMRKLRDRLAWATVALAAVAFIWVGYASYLGGKIRHAEELGYHSPQSPDAADVNMYKRSMGLIPDVFSKSTQIG